LAIVKQFGAISRATVTTVLAPVIYTVLQFKSDKSKNTPTCRSETKLVIFIDANRNGGKTKEKDD
jgi:hypothetical protein